MKSKYLMNIDSLKYYCNGRAKMLEREVLHTNCCDSINYDFDVSKPLPNIIFQTYKAFFILYIILFNYKYPAEVQSVEIHTCL